MAESTARPFEWAGDRRGVLLLHGLTGTPFEVRALGERLHQNRGMTVSGPLLAGHGTSPRALAATGWMDWEASALAALDALAKRCDRVVAGGLSMGGLLAVRLAIRRPEVVRALVLMSVPLWLPRLTSAFVRLLARLGHPWALPKLGGSDVRDRQARRDNPAYDQFPVHAVTELLALQAEVSSGLFAVRQPTLIVHARRDHTAPPACARALADRLGARDVRLRWLDRSYHLLPIDVERERVAQLVGDFVEEKLR